MTCVICKHGETEPGVTTVTLERDGLTLVLKRVPARVCPNCFAKAGAVVDVREYAGA